MAVGEQRGVSDALRKMYQDVASMQLLPDAPNHAPFLSGLMQAIQKYLQTQAAGSANLGTPGGAQAGMGGPGGGMGGMPPGGMGGGMGGGMNPGGPSAPPGMSIAPGGGAGMSGLMQGGGGGVNPDELRRLLAQGAPG